MIARWKTPLRTGGIVVGLLAALALAAHLAGTPGRSGRLAGTMLSAPATTLPTVVAAALVDAINPCAFTLLLIFITSVTAFLQVAQGKSL